MPTVIALAFIAVAVFYSVLCALLYGTQSKREPRLLPTVVPFLDPVIGIFRRKVNFYVDLRKRYRLPIHTMRMPFQRLYIVDAPQLIHAVQSKVNMSTFVPNLLDFGMLFSGLNKRSRKLFKQSVDLGGNSFTQSVHKYLSSGNTLQAASRAAVNKLSASIPNNFAEVHRSGLLETIRHDLTLALTGAVYGPENPFDHPEIEKAWLDFVPGISHLLYSPLPSLTARKAIRARSRIVDAFAKYFEEGGHIEAFPMIPEMHELHKNSGLTLTEAAKLEMATSLAMLSSGAITTFWLMFHILSDPAALSQCRHELLDLVTKETDSETGKVKVVDVSLIKAKCPTMMAMLQETLRYHSTLINIKKVQHDTTLASQYHLKKDAIVMISATAVHHDSDVWGASATTFDHQRFLSPAGHKKLQSTLAYRPFGAGATMCPGRHFSTNVILSLAAMVLLQFDVEPVGEHKAWRMPTKKDADLWNAMPKPDEDVKVRITPRKEMECVEWKFVWGIPEEK